VQFGWSDEWKNDEVVKPEKPLWFAQMLMKMLSGHLTKVRSVSGGGLKVLIIYTPEN